MSREIVAKQLELYSNGIVAFNVLQGVGFAFYLGTNCQFNYLIKNATYLAEGLTVLFSLVAIGSVFAILAFRKAMISVSDPEFHDIQRWLYLAKACAAFVFGALPLFLTVFYGLSASAPLPMCDQ